MGPSRSESACLLLKERCAQNPGFQEALFYEMDLQRKVWSVFNISTAFSQHDKEFMFALGNEFGWLAVAKAMWYLWQEEQEIKSFGEKLKSFFNK